MRCMSRGGSLAVLALGTGLLIAMPAAVATNDAFTPTAAPALSSDGSGLHLNAVDCSSPGNCVAVGTDAGSGAIDVESNGSWTAVPLTAQTGAPHSAGVVNVRVQVSSGISSAITPADRYTYVAPPVVTNVSPPKGTRHGGTKVTITGHGLSGATKVKFGAVAGTQVKVRSASTIVVTAPPHSAGQVDVRVVTQGGTSKTSKNDTFALPDLTAGSGKLSSGGQERRHGEAYAECSATTVRSLNSGGPSNVSAISSRTGPRSTCRCGSSSRARASASLSKVTTMYTVQGSF
jgi:hypothetical protein